MQSERKDRWTSTERLLDCQPPPYQQEWKPDEGMKYSVSREKNTVNLKFCAQQKRISEPGEIEMFSNQ